MHLETLHDGPATRIVQMRLVVETRGQGFHEITGALREAIARAGIDAGLAQIFCRHTSASLTIQENADPDVVRDLLDALDGFAPRTAPYRHGSEGPDDMPAHIRTLLTDVALTIPIHAGRPALGTWQGLWLIEHRDRPHRREVLITLHGG